MPKRKSQTIGDRLIELGITRTALARALDVGERTVYRWLAYDVELRLSVTQFSLLCDLLQWNAAQLAAAYDSGSITKKTGPGAAVAPGQISLLTDI